MDNPPVVKSNGDTVKTCVLLFFKCPKLHMAILSISSLLRGGLSTDILNDPSIRLPSFLLCLYIFKGRRRTKMKIKALRTKSASYSEDIEPFTIYFSLISK